MLSGWFVDLINIRCVFSRLVRRTWEFPSQPWLGDEIFVPKVAAAKSSKISKFPFILWVADLSFILHAFLQRWCHVWSCPDQSHLLLHGLQCQVHQAILFLQILNFKKHHGTRFCGAPSRFTYSFGPAIQKLGRFRGGPSRFPHKRT